jgi:hypothetical protein
VRTRESCWECYHHCCYDYVGFFSLETTEPH